MKSVASIRARCHSDDWDLWIRLSKVCEFACVNRELVRYVHHDLQQHKSMKTACASVLILSEASRPLEPLSLGALQQQSHRRTCYALIYHAAGRSRDER